MDTSHGVWLKTSESVESSSSSFSFLSSDLLLNFENKDERDDEDEPTVGLALKLFKSDSLR